MSERHVLPGEQWYEGVLFFGYSPPDILDAVKNFQVRDDDVFIVAYPKAGKTKYLYTCIFFLNYFKTFTCKLIAYIKIANHLHINSDVSSCSIKDGLVWFMVFNATFNNISVISCRSVLLMEETGVPGKNHLPVN